MNPPVLEPIADKLTYLNTKEAAELLGISPYTLRAKRSRQRGTRRRPGPPWHDLDGGIVYRRDEVEAYIESRRRTLKRPVPARLAE